MLMSFKELHIDIKGLEKASKFRNWTRYLARIHHYEHVRVVVRIFDEKIAKCAMFLKMNVCTSNLCIIIV